MKYVDVCIGNEEDAELCLGFKPDAGVEGGNTDAAGYDGKEFYQGGLIHGMLKYPGGQASALEFAVAASALKHTINGDFNLVSEVEVLSLVPKYKPIEI